MKQTYLHLSCFTLLLLLFTSTALHSQEMVGQNKLWSYYTDAGVIGEGPDSHPTGYTTVYSFGMPEMIEGQTYYRLQIGEHFDYGTFWDNTNFLMREDAAGRVYLKEDGFPEVLIYDFSLAVDDVFNDVINDCSIQLLAKDSVTLNSGGQWERFTFADESTWIKGVGSTSSLIPSCLGESSDLICFQSGADLEYAGELFDQTVDYCYFVPVSTSEISNKAISIFPNPVLHSFLIQSEEEPLNGHLVIYNAMGQRVYQTTVSQTFRKEIDLSAYPAGSYYLELGAIKQKLMKVD